MRLLLIGVAMSATLTAAGEGPADQLQEFRRDVCAVLAKLDPNPKDRDAAREALRRDLWKVVDKHAKLRPEKGSKTYVSPDKAFVLVIAANGAAGRDGETASAEDNSATLVLAVGGVGGSGGKSGGMAQARAKAGIALALGGRGGQGAGGGAGAGAQGGIASIGLGGEGGTSADGSEGGEGGSIFAGDYATIAAAARKLGGK